MDQKMVHKQTKMVILKGGTYYWLTVWSGVTQWSVLGPCLFLIYINDFNLSIAREILKFADDTKVTCPIEKDAHGAALHDRSREIAHYI